MNILILNWRDIKNPYKGGAEIILYEFARRLRQRGNNVTWFSESFKGALKEEKFNGINIVRRGNRYSVYLHAFLYYKKLKEKPDVVLDCVNTICWQTPLYVNKSRRIFYANQSAREIFFYEYPFPVSLIGFLLEPLQYLTYKNTKILCYSPSIKKDLMTFGLPEKNINVFPLGIDHDRYKPGKKSLSPTFTFVARFVKNKRPDLCIEAMRLVVQKNPKIRLYLVGYGPEEESLIKKIKDYNLTENIIIVNKNNLFLKKNTKDMKVKLMQNAWGLILPSVKEGWGMVVTEAAACGTPSIVSNVTGLKDSVDDKKTGFILSKKPEASELATSILKIVEDKKLRKTLFQNAIVHSKNFSWEKSFRVFYSYINEKNIKN